MARCACDGHEGSYSGVLWRVVAQHALRARQVLTVRANTTGTYPQKIEHRRPARGHNVSGRQRQPLALPRGVRNAGGGLEIEGQRGELGVVQDAGDEVASGSSRDVVVIL